MSRRSSILWTLLPALVLLAACKPESKLSQLPDEDILAEVEYCDSLRSPSSLKQVICDNHRRECKRRQLCAGS